MVLDMRLEAVVMAFGHARRIESGMVQIADGDRDDESQRHVTR